MDEPDAPCLELAEGNYCASYGDICRNSCHPDCMRELYFKKNNLVKFEYF